MIKQVGWLVSLIVIGCSFANNERGRSGNSLLTEPVRILDQSTFAVLRGKDTLEERAGMVCILKQEQDKTTGETYMTYELENFIHSKKENGKIVFQVDTKFNRDPDLVINRLIKVFKAHPLKFRLNEDGLPAGFINFNAYAAAILKDEVLLKNKDGIKAFIDSLNMKQRMADLFAAAGNSTRMERERTIFLNGFSDPVTGKEIVNDAKTIKDTVIAEVSVQLPLQENYLDSRKIVLSGKGNRQMQADKNTHLLFNATYRYTFNCEIEHGGGKDSLKIGMMRKVNRVFIANQ